MAGGNVSFNSSFTISKKNFALGGMKVSKSQTRDIVAIAPKPLGTNLKINIDTMGTGVENLDGVASITIPASTINQRSEISLANDLRFVAVIYDNTKLFQMPEGSLIHSYISLVFILQLLTL